MIELEKFLMENNLSGEYYFEDFFPEWNDYDDSVTIGYLNSEDQAEGYFHERYPLTAETYTLREEVYEFGYEYGVIVSGYDYSAAYIFKTKEEAFEYAKSLENTELPSIEEYIEKFKKLINESDNIEIKPYYEVTHPHGYWTSYNIYFDDMMIYDGAFELDEELAEEINGICEVLNCNEEFYGFKIDSIKKIKGFPSWEKLYEVRLRKNNFYTTVDIDLHYYQQKSPRSVIKVIENEINWDSVINDYEDELEL